MPGGSLGYTLPGGGCPAFVPADLVRSLSQNAPVVNDIALAMSTLGGAVPVIGIPVEALSVVLTALANGCDVSETFQSECKQSALGCTIGAVACGIGSVAAAIGVVSAPAVVALVPAGAVLAALAPVLNAMGDGKVPKLSDVGGAVTALGSLGGSNVDLGPLKGAMQGLASSAPIVNQLVNDKTVKAALASSATAHTNDAKMKALANAKQKAASIAQACKDAGGHYDPRDPTADAHGCAGTHHDVALQSAKQKAASIAQACKDAGGHYDPRDPTADAHGCAGAHNASTSPGALKKKKTVPTSVGGIVGAVGGFVVGGPVGGAIGAGLGALLGNKLAGAR